MTISAITSTPATLGSPPLDTRPNDDSSRWLDYFAKVGTISIPMRKRKDATSHSTNTADSPSSSASKRMTSGGDKVTVRFGDALWNIVGRYDVPGTTRYQKMVAILNANPHAFIDNDMNRLKAGTQLSLPSAEAVRAVDAADALRLVSGQVDAYEQMRQLAASRMRAPDVLSP